MIEELDKRLENYMTDTATPEALMGEHAAIMLSDRVDGERWSEQDSTPPVVDSTSPG